MLGSVFLNKVFEGGTLHFSVPVRMTRNYFPPLALHELFRLFYSDYNKLYSIVAKNKSVSTLKFLIGHVL